MTIADKLLLGISTTVDGMGIVFIVLIVLWAIIVAQSKLISVITERYKKPQTIDLSVNMEKVNIESEGITSGESRVPDVIDDETQAVIMAVVSNCANIPLSRLQFKSIKAL